MKFSFKTLTQIFKSESSPRKKNNPERDWFIIIVGSAVALIIIIVIGLRWLFVLAESYALPPAGTEEKIETKLDVRTIEETLNIYRQKNEEREQILESGVQIIDPSL